MKGTENMAARDMNKFKDKFNSIYFNNSTYQAALVASGSVLEVRFFYCNLNLFKPCMFYPGFYLGC